MKHFGNELEYLLLCDFISKAKLSTVGFERAVSIPGCGVSGGVFFSFGNLFYGDF